jgi:hypothetical protein
MLDIAINTSRLERFARDLERMAPYPMDEIRKGNKEATDATRDAIKEFTPKREGKTVEGVVSAFRNVGSTEVEGYIKALPIPGRPENLFEMLDRGTKPHEIRPKQARNAKGKRTALKFQVGAATLFRPSVHHPGTKPYHQVARGIEAAAPARDRAYRNTIRRIIYRLRR